ncbi:MAG: hypothetical protein H8E73_09020 [Planctomycetes bacterium]|nr:hypothetical protein [Planctomycetota bacterium]MBL7154619.1 hypothetical protein [Phycisphaerae bacterium]
MCNDTTLKNKIAILPCTGIGQVVGTIARQAAYRICEDLRPRETVLCCLPALVKGVHEDIDMIEDCPVIVIEGCREFCATYSLKLQQGTAAAVISVPEVIKGNNLKIKRSARRRLTQPELNAVELVAEAAVAQIDKLRTSAPKGRK